MRCVFAYIACASVLMPIHALADWQYTKWGMSVEQAARASDGQLRAPTAPERSAQVVNGVAPGLVGTYRSATFNFKCALYFTSTNLGLGRVTLTAMDYQQSRTIIESLRGLYGEPIEFSHGRFGDKFRWRDDPHDN